MRKLRYIVTVVLGALSLGTWSQDYARMSESSISGTARYVGMGGAMTAIGGDPSAALDNVAGLGLYRRSEATVTFEELIDKTWQNGTTGHWLRHGFMCSQAAIVVSIPSFSNSNKGVQFNNLMFSYHRKNAYMRTLEGVGGEGNSLGSILPSLDIPFANDPTVRSYTQQLFERGYSNVYSFDWAMNISNRWYIGAGLRVHSVFLSSDGIYLEKFSRTNAEGKEYYNKNATSLQLTNVSCGFSVGAIYRPVQWLRLGFGLETPSLGSLRIYTAGTLTSQTDSLRSSYAPDLRLQDTQFHLPLHLSSSVAFQIGGYGMIGLQYDYTKQQYHDAVHSLRAGIEVIPVMGMYINAGYAYESTFRPATTAVPIDATFDRQDTYYLRPRNTQYASVAVGYRGKHMLIQAAYQFRWQQINLYAHEKAEPYDMRTNTHRIVLTIGWHRGD